MDNQDLGDKIQGFGQKIAGEVEQGVDNVRDFASGRQDDVQGNTTVGDRLNTNAHSAANDAGDWVQNRAEDAHNAVDNMSHDAQRNADDMGAAAQRNANNAGREVQRDANDLSNDINRETNNTSF